MLIDWFTVGAQILNFLILVWLLRRFLYRPVLAAIDAREKTVAAKIADAAALQMKAQLAGEELRKRSEAFEQEREGVMRKATDEGAAERQQLIEAARQDSQALRAKLASALAAEREELRVQLSLRTQVEVFAMARKALADLAGMSLEDRIVAVFIERLSRAPVDAGAARVALVRSAFELAPVTRAAVEDALHKRLGTAIEVRFEASPELVCGIDLTVDGIKLAWSVAAYLSALAADAAGLATTELAVAAPEATHAH